MNKLEIKRSAETNSSTSVC